MPHATVADNASFDFIIVGGGAAGLVLASRLTEIPHFNVLVVEAGSDNRDDFLVNTPGTFLQLYGNPKYDWDFKTVPQKHADNATFAWPRGKGLGGSSMINFMMYSHCSKGDLDAWVKCGNEGWGWEDMLPYFQKVEHIHLPENAARTALELEYIQPEMRGKSGPIQTSFPQESFSWLQEGWVKAGREMAYPELTDPRTGSSLGLFHQLTTVEPETGRRSYAANTYLSMAEGRENLTVLSESLVKRVIFDKGKMGRPRASGVEVETASGTIVVKANNEVLLCAGSIQTPQLLELSGIGGRDLLEKHRIPVVVENSNVGEHLMDHVIVPMSYEVNEGVATAEAMRDHPELVGQLTEMYATTQKGPLAQAPTTTGFLPIQIVAPDSKADQKIANLAKLGSKLPGKQLEILLGQLQDPKEAEFQIVAMPTGVDPSNRGSQGAIFFHSKPGAHVTVAAGSTHEFSRGTTHIKSNDVHDYPSVDPNYFGNPADLEKLAYGILHAKNLVTTTALGQYVKSKPGTNEKITMQGFPTELDTLEQAKAWARRSAFTMYHPVATASMMPKEDGGVVDTALNVYGVDSLRVVDASIFPLHIQGNIISLVYAVAEKASDLLKRAYA